MKWLKKSDSIDYQCLVQQTEDADPQIKLFGIIMMISYPLFGVFGKFENFQLSEEFFFRLIATVLCAGLATNQFWPRSLLKFLPLFWYAILMFCLPFFFCYLTLIYHCSTIWLLNCATSILFLLLVTSISEALVLLFFGFGLAFFVYFLSHRTIEYFPGHISLSSLFVSVIATLIISALFARSRGMVYARRYVQVSHVERSMERDLSTFFSSIFFQAKLQEITVNKSEDSEACNQLHEGLHAITWDVETKSHIVNTPLGPIQNNKFNTNNFGIYPINDVIKKAMDDYPLKEIQKNRIQINYENNFAIWLDELSFKNFLWNLLDTILKLIEVSEKRTISIWLEIGAEKDDFNYFHVEGTAWKKYAKNLVPLIILSVWIKLKNKLIKSVWLLKSIDAFQWFFNLSQNDNTAIESKNFEKTFENFSPDCNTDTDLGLSYCKWLMQEAGGDLSCTGRINEFVHFIVKFPKID